MYFGVTNQNRCGSLWCCGKVYFGNALPGGWLKSDHGNKLQDVLDDAIFSAGLRPSEVYADFLLAVIIYCSGVQNNNPASNWDLSWKRDNFPVKYKRSYNFTMHHKL